MKKKHPINDSVSLFWWVNQLFLNHFIYIFNKDSKINFYGEILVLFARANHPFSSLTSDLFMVL